VKRPSFFRWARRWFRGGLIVAAGFAAVLAVVNMVDALPFCLAVRRIHRLSGAEVKDLAAACSRLEPGGHQRWLKPDIPPAFGALKPVRVDIYPGASDISLFEKDDDTLYVFLRVETTPDNQRVECVSSGPDGQHFHVLWQRDPLRAAQSRPMNRIVTVTESTMHSSRHWIVLPHEIVAVESPYSVGAADAITRWPLDERARAAIGAAMGEIGSEIRGHAFDLGAADGIGLRVTFAATGDAGPDDIVLRNTWRPELAPLVDAISGVAGADHRIRFAGYIQRRDREFPQPPRIQVMTLREFNRRQNWIPLPWWRLWPRLEVAKWF